MVVHYILLPHELGIKKKKRFVRMSGPDLFDRKRNGHIIFYILNAVHQMNSVNYS